MIRNKCIRIQWLEKTNNLGDVGPVTVELISNALCTIRFSTPQFVQIRIKFKVIKILVIYYILATIQLWVLIAKVAHTSLLKFNCKCLIAQIIAHTSFPQSNLIISGGLRLCFCWNRSMLPRFFWNRDRYLFSLKLHWCLMTIATYVDSWWWFDATFQVIRIASNVGMVSWVRWASYSFS